MPAAGLKKEENMSKFPKFDQKETKEGNIRRIVSKCLERMKHGNVRPCEEEKTEEVVENTENQE